MFLIFCFCNKVYSLVPYILRVTKNNIFDFENYAYLEPSDELTLSESFSTYEDFYCGRIDISCVL